MPLRPTRRNPELRPSPWGKNLAGMDLSGQDLSYMDLAKADFSGANLTKTDLTGSQLRGARFDGAQLVEAKLIGTTLSFARLGKANAERADFTGAQLGYAYLSFGKFRQADFTRADLFKAECIRADLRGTTFVRALLHDTQLMEAGADRADFTEASLLGAKLSRAALRAADFSKADLRRAKAPHAYFSTALFFGADLRESDFSRADLTSTTLEGVNFSHAQLGCADFTAAGIKAVNFTEAILTGASLEGATLTDVDFTGADLEGADLKGAKIEGITWTGVDLTRVKNMPRTGPLREHYSLQPTDSSAFNKWFGESVVVVGDDKKPVVVYHGTTRGGFTKFDLKQLDPHHNAFYFADNMAVAETYVDEMQPVSRPDPLLAPREKHGIYRLYIKLVNPMIIEGAGRSWNGLSDDRAPGLRKTYEFAKWAEAHGHDGVIFKDVVDSGGQGAELAPPATVYAVFDPKAIKSATANNGNYDPNDPDIRHNPAIKPSSVATIIFDERGRVLILRRGSTAPWMPGKWSLPGGTVDPGEGLQQAALREAIEETTLVVERVRPLVVIAHEPEGWSAAFFVSKPGEWRGKVELDYENDAFAWISERDISRYSFIPTVVGALHTAFKRRARASR